MRFCSFGASAKPSSVSAFGWSCVVLALMIRGTGLEAAKDFIDAVDGAVRVKKIVRHTVALFLTRQPPVAPPFQGFGGEYLVLFFACLQLESNAYAASKRGKRISLFSWGFPSLSSFSVSIIVS